MSRYRSIIKVWINDTFHCNTHTASAKMSFKLDTTGTGICLSLHFYPDIKGNPADCKNVSVLCPISAPCINIHHSQGENETAGDHLYKDTHLHCYSMNTH